MGVRGGGRKVKGREECMPQWSSGGESVGHKSTTAWALILYECSVSLPGRHGKGS